MRPDSVEMKSLRTTLYQVMLKPLLSSLEEAWSGDGAGAVRVNGAFSEAMAKELAESLNPEAPKEAAHGVE